MIGLHTDERVALAKALLGASLVPPRPGEEGALALLSIADRDKALLPRLAQALATAGYQFAATRGTREQLARLGLSARLVSKVGQPVGSGEESILDLIASGEVRLVATRRRRNPVRCAMPPRSLQRPRKGSCA